MIPHHNEKPKQLPPNYAARSVQYRLLVLVGSLLTIFFLMAEAAKPKNWEWMWQLDGAAKEIEPEIVDDTSLPREALPQEGQATEQAAYPADSFLAKKSQKIQLDLPNSVEVEKKLLSVIKDNTFFRSEESDVWFHLFAVLKNSESEELRSSSVGPVSFVQLFRQTEEYRGKLVDVRGTVRRAFWVPAPANELKIRGYWQCFVQPEGSNSPFVIYSLNLPNGFPEGMDLSEPIAASGFCFKRWAYQAQGGPMIAPVILAKDAEWMPVPPPVEKPPLAKGLISRTFLVAGFAGLVLCGIVFFATVSQPVRSLDRDRKNVEQFSRTLGDRQLPNTIDNLREIEKQQMG